MQKSRLKKYYALVALILLCISPTILFAQSEFIPCDGTGTPNDAYGADCPIDTGTAALVSITLLCGALYIYRQQEKAQSTV